MQNSFVGATTSTTWHQRLGHTSLGKLKFILSTISLDAIFSNFSSHCPIYHFAKKPRCSFPFIASSSSYAFELIHMDVWGNFSTPTIDGKSYFLTLVDDFTRFTWTFLIALKSRCCQIFQNFYASILTQFDKKI